MQRFWQDASVRAGNGGFAVLLDDKPMRIPGRIPGGTPLLLPNRAMADAIAGEWQAAGGEKGRTMSMNDVPLTRLAGTAQDRIAPDPAPVADALARYAETDLLCYRASHPAPLVIRQARAWQPWLDWLARTHGARLIVAEGVMHQRQDPASLAAVQRAMAAQTPSVLAALGIAIPSLGSAVLGLALADGALNAEAAHELGSLDELFQVELWGEDAEATRRRAGVAADVALAGRFIALSRAP